MHFLLFVTLLVSIELISFVQIFSIVPPKQRRQYFVCTRVCVCVYVCMCTCVNII